MSCVPWLILLQKQHAAPALMQALDERAVGRGVTVTPGRGDREADDDDVVGHIAGASTLRRQTGRRRASCSTRTVNHGRVQQRAQLARAMRVRVLRQHSTTRGFAYAT